MISPAMMNANTTIPKTSATTRRSLMIQVMFSETVAATSRMQRATKKPMAF